MIRVAIVGALGRMGKILTKAVTQSSTMTIGSLLVRPGNISAGSDASSLLGNTVRGIKINTSLESVIDSFDVLIDFTSPDSSLLNLEVCSRFKKPIVIGTTGLDTEQTRILYSYASCSKIVFSPNMNVGINLCLELISKTARVLDSDYDIEILETHHRYKVDSPSGTALRLGEVIANSLGFNFFDHIIRSNGDFFLKSPSGKKIIFKSIRQGDVIGDHKVSFFNKNERIEIFHQAIDRMSFAQGALTAASWILTQQVGIYDMNDILR
jgi:4-hydroxy-tetrahydrodipicolinate reductase